jgi:hypothetical protein
MKSDYYFILRTVRTPTPDLDSRFRFQDCRFSILVFQFQFQVSLASRLMEYFQEVTLLLHLTNLTMGQTTSNSNFTTAVIPNYLEIIRANARPLNILLIGEQGDGKSSAGNTMYASATGNHVPLMPVAGDRNARGTTKYRRHAFGNLGGNIAFFDCPGHDFDTPQQLNLLNLILAGLEENTTLPETDDKIADALRNGELRAKPANAISFVVWVVKATKLETDSKQFLFWSWAYVNSSTRDYYRRIWDAVKSGTSLGTIKLA